MKDAEDLQYESQYNIIAKNICVCYQIERRVKKIQIFGDSLALEAQVLFTSFQEMSQTSLFNKNESKQLQLLFKDEEHLDKCLDRYSEERIHEFLLNQLPLGEVVLT
ncbi:unnamed protein product [Paramecium octaurelia]|uniref:Uncharacterized protein n=1 Tax=Paramecium octaurelia TaxID=43137 RepID=A0A8S1VW42_PAROT|nr:unnamed protein product [Paramecium octaurelia]